MTASGFPRSAASTGMGMPNMRNRVVSLGGDFDIQSVPGEGTTVRIVLPM